MKRLNNDVFELFSQSSPDIYFYLTDLKTGMSRWSPNVERDFGQQQYSTVETNIWDTLVHPADYPKYYADISAVFAGKSQSHNCEYRARTLDGQYVWLRCSGVVTMDEDGQPNLFGGAMVRLDIRNRYDPITGLRILNVDDSQRVPGFSHGHPGTFLLVGIDDFRSTINRYGYHFGDLLLKQFAENAFRQLKESADCGCDCELLRYIKDEFVVLIPDGSDEPAQKAFGVLQQVAYHLGLFDQNVDLSITGAILHFPEDGKDISELVTRAEQTLHYAKLYHRGTAICYNQQIEQYQSRRSELETLLTQSIHNHFDGFEMYYMPLVNRISYRMESCEALLRFKPGMACGFNTEDVINTLERSGEIHAVGRWVIENVFSQASEWQQHGKFFGVSLNVSALQLKDPSFIDFLIGAAEARQLEMSLITIELTESIKLISTSEVVSSLERLKKAGMKISLDDFGTGYATLTMLQELPVDYVKIDHSFVTKMSENRPKDRAIVSSIITLCNSLDIGVVVEGVETREIAGLLSMSSVHYLQGWYFSKPVPVREFETMINKQFI